MLRPFRFSRAHTLTALALLLPGCASSPPEDLRAPELVTLTGHYAGDPLRGPLPEPEALELELDPDQALPLRATLYLVANLPIDRYPSLGEHVRLIVAEGGTKPLQPRASLTADTRLVLGEEAAELQREVAARPPAEAVRAASFEDLSVPRITTTLAATHVQPVELDGSRPAERRSRIELWREEAGADEVSLAVVLSDVVEVVEGLADSGPRVVPRPRLETLFLDTGIAIAAGPVALITPARFAPGSGLAYVMFFEVEAGPTDGGRRVALDELLERAASDVRASAREDTGRRERLLAADGLRLRLQRAVETLGEEEHRRAALAQLAGTVDAPLVTELALVADEAFCERFCAQVLAAPDRISELCADGDGLAWFLESTAVRLLVADLGGAGIAPEYAALLVGRTGAAARYPGVLESAVGAATSVTEFDERILEENRIALEDSSPASRVRAYDWLLAQGIEVPGFDPLAERGERRAALRAWARAEAEAEEGDTAAVEEGP